MKIFSLPLLACLAAATGPAAEAGDLELQIQINNTSCYVESTNDQRSQPECDAWSINGRNEKVFRDNLRLTPLPRDPHCDTCADEFWVLDYRLHFRNEISGDQARFLVRIMASSRQRGGSEEFNISASTVGAEDPKQSNGASFTLADFTAFRSLSLDLPRTLHFSLADQSIVKLNPLVTIRKGPKSGH